MRGDDKMAKFKNIEAERGRAGMSRTELSKNLGVSMTTYKRYVDGDSPIPSDTLLRMTKLLDCSADYLLGLDEKR